MIKYIAHYDVEYNHESLKLLARMFKPTKTCRKISLRWNWQRFWEVIPLNFLGARTI